MFIKNFDSKTFGAAAAALLVAGVFGVAQAQAASVMKECGDEWKAAKTAGTTGAQTWPEFLKACRSQKEGGAAAPTVAAPVAPVAPIAPVEPSKPSKLGKPAAVATGAGQFGTEGEAKTHCPTGTVVWVNTKSKIWHYSGHPDYGHTKRGAYECEADAAAGGFRAARDEKPK